MSQGSGTVVGRAHLAGAGRAHDEDAVFAHVEGGDCGAREFSRGALTPCRCEWLRASSYIVPHLRNTTTTPIRFSVFLFLAGTMAA